MTEETRNTVVIALEVYAAQLAKTIKKIVDDEMGALSASIDCGTSKNITRRVGETLDEFDCVISAFDAVNRE